MRLVIIESPFAGTDEEMVWHTTYARAALRDSLMRGEAPFASHLLYTQVLDDLSPKERRLGISAGLEWGFQAAATVVYDDLGISAGMRVGIAHAVNNGRPVEYRRLGGEWASR